MSLLLSGIAILFGVIVALSPTQAAKIWASGRLEALDPGKRILFLRSFRAFGIVLFLGGLLLAIDSIWLTS